MDELSLLLGVIGLFYDAVFDESKWRLACERLIEFVGGTSAGFVIANPQSEAITHCETIRIDPDFTSKYLNYYATREVRLAPALKYAPGTVMTERMLLEKRALQTSEIYADLLLPYDVPHFMFAWTRKSPRGFETFAVENSHARGEFEADAIERYRALLPHITRAIRMREHVFAVRQATSALRDVLDTIPYGILFLDHEGLILDLTPTAERILREGGGLKALKNSLRAAERDADAHLQRAISHAVRCRKDKVTPGDTIYVRRPGRTSALTVYIFPLQSAEVPLFTRPVSAVVMIIDPEAFPSTTVSTIRLGLHLTDAEAHLTSYLLKGISLRAAALALNVSINTAKSQLKSIYGKTGCRNHAQLVRKVMGISLATSFVR